MENTYNSICNFLRNLLGLDKIIDPSQFGYPSDYKILKVRHQGNIRWKKSNIYLRSSLAGEYVGVKKIDEQYYGVYFESKLIETLDRFRLCTI